MADFDNNNNSTKQITLVSQGEKHVIDVPPDIYALFSAHEVNGTPAEMEKVIGWCRQKLNGGLKEAWTDEYLNVDSETLMGLTILSHELGLRELFDKCSVLTAKFIKQRMTGKTTISAKDFL